MYVCRLESYYILMRWNLHGLSIDGTTNDPDVRDRWRASFAPLPESTNVPDVQFELDVVDTLPDVPANEAISPPADSLTYYTEEPYIVAHLPRGGQLRFDLSRGFTTGHIVPTALHTYGVFEDIIAAGLSPHLRRRGFFALNAFAAARDEYAVLLVGNDSIAKTTVGISLIDAGWKLLSLATPLLAEDGELLSFPGLLAAQPDTYANFSATSDIADRAVRGLSSQSIVVSPDAIWPDVWAERASIRSLFFMRFEERDRPAVETMQSADALRRLVPHAIEQWDREMVPRHLRLLRRVIDLAPAYKLRLGPDVSSIPALLASAL